MRAPVKVRFSELDPYGHVNHAVYVEYFEIGRAESLERVGIDLHELARSGTQLVVTELRVRYRASAVGGDALEVVSSIERLARVSSTWRQRIERGGEVLCEAEVKIGVIGPSGRPTRLDDALVERLAPLLAS
ncbi:MAG: thioesterase family protein [Actinomycetota bacterium]|nr:thioesterase family protein [Actinomycetota bacterium]